MCVVVCIILDECLNVGKQQNNTFVFLFMCVPKSDIYNIYVHVLFVFAFVCLHVVCEGVLMCWLVGTCTCVFV